jgi:hypothetical protein
LAQVAPPLSSMLSRRSFAVNRKVIDAKNAKRLKIQQKKKKNLNKVSVCNCCSSCRCCTLYVWCQCSATLISNSISYILCIFMSHSLLLLRRRRHPIRPVRKIPPRQCHRHSHFYSIKNGLSFSNRFQFLVFKPGKL